MAQQQKVGRVATTIHTEDGSTRVIYHQTTVVQFDNDLIVLDTGGWKTPTTKTRMNQAASQFNLGYRVYQEDFAWYVRWNGESLPFDEDGTIELDRAAYSGTFAWDGEPAYIPCPECGELTWSVELNQCQRQNCRFVD